jgi:transposase
LRAAEQDRPDVHGVRQAIAAAGASLLYLPPYSPDLNPIEQLFAKLKALLRRAAARTRDTPWTTIGRLLATYSPSNAPTTSTTALWFHLT